MRSLRDSNPEIWDYLTNGRFSLQLSQGNTFGKIPMDQAIEETANKDTQTPGRTKGFSLKPGAVSRYYILLTTKVMCETAERWEITTKPLEENTKTSNHLESGGVRMTFKA